MKQRQRIFYPMLAVVIPLAFLSFMYGINDRYFFIDDMTEEAMPKCYDIGRTLRAGQFPTLTTNNMIGAAYAAEYQHAVFNPVELAICFTISLFGHYGLAGLFMSAVHLILTAIACFLLARNLGLKNSTSLLVSVVITLGYHNLYWNAPAWYPAEAGRTWVMFVAAFLAPALRMGKLANMNILGLFVSCFFCFTSGWPLSPIIVAFAVAISLVHLIFVERNTRTAVTLTLTVGAALMASSVALLPFISFGEFASRASGTFNRRNHLVAPLDALIEFSNPSYLAFYSGISGYSRSSAPHFYAAWFLMPYATIISWSRTLILRRGTWVWLALALLSALLTMGPEHVGSIRFPLRSVVYFHAFLTLFLITSAAVCGLELSPRRLVACGILTIFSFVHALQAAPDKAAHIAWTMLFVGFCMYILFLLIRRKLNADFFLVSSSVLVVMSIFILHPIGRGGDRGFPLEADKVRNLGKKDYLLFYGGYPSAKSAQAQSEYHISSTGLFIGERTINGYSSSGHKRFRDIVCLDDHGNFHDTPKICAKEMFELHPITKLTFLETMRVDRIVVMRGRWEDDFDRHTTDRYIKQNQLEFTSTYDYAGNFQFPGLISWISDGIELGPPDDKTHSFTHTEERTKIARTPPGGGEVVFARLWYPGYEAYLGNRKLDVRTHRGAFVSVRLPGSSSGTLTLRYLTPHFRIGLGLALAGLAILMVILWKNRKGRSHKSHPM